MASIHSLALLLSLAFSGLVMVIPSAEATAFPATAEVDLIFPRNETYAPSEIFPIVFASQNPQLAPALDPGIDLSILQDGDVNANRVFIRELDLSKNNFSGSDPYFVYTFITNISTTANGDPTPYLFMWDFGAGNCSGSGTGMSFGGGMRHNFIWFTIQSGAQTPDLAKSNDAPTCSNTSHFAFNITNIQNVPDPSADYGRNTCAVFSDVQPLVSGNPCAVQLSSATAHNISAGINATLCSVIDPVISCPATSAALGQRNSGWPTSYAAIWSGLLSFYLISVYS